MNYAQRLMEELQGRGFPAFLDDSGPFISVQTGGYDNLEEAVRLEQNLRKAGYDTLIIS